MYLSTIWIFLFNSLPWGSVLMKLPPMHPIQTFQHWNCLLTKLLRISHPGLLQIICPSGHPLFFFVYRRMRFLILGRSVGLNKKKPKKNHKKFRNSRPWYPRTTLKINIHILGLTKCTIYCEKCSCFCSCFFSMLLLCLFFRLKERIISSEKWCDYVVFENAKNLGPSDDGKRRKKKRMASTAKKKTKLWSWVSTLMNLLFILATRFDSWCSYRRYVVLWRPPINCFKEGLCQGWRIWDDLESWCLLISHLCCTRLIYFHTLNIVVHYF